MTFTYDLPIASDLHRVRLYIHDTDSATAQYQDEELDELLSEESDPLAAAILAVDGLIGRYSRIGTFRVGDTSIDGLEIVKGYRFIADALRARQTGAPLPYAGGIDVTDVENRQADSTRVTPSFTRLEVS